MTTVSPADRYVVLDEEGYFSFDGKRVNEDTLGRAMIENMKLDTDGRLTTTLNDNDAFVEYFDAPLLGRHVRLVDKQCGELDLSYGATARFAFSSLSLDEWDRIHGVTETLGKTKKEIPFVFTRHGQVEFFEILESFDDESITISGTRFELPSWLTPCEESEQPGFWSDHYKAGTTDWDMGGAHSALPVILPQLKIPKSRVLVLGAGLGHDAAYLAKLGHLVTAVDFSEEAVNRAKEKYGGTENLNFVRADAFNLPEKWTGEFDMVFEHTCFCAISPEKRNQLIKVWRQVLQPGGHLLGVFFVSEKRQGPPIGGSEWELRQRFKTNFNFLYWTRWRLSVDRRKGQELIVYARKKEL